MNPYLTTRMVKLIEKIRDSEDQELTQAVPGGWWVGNDRVQGATCWALLRMCLIRAEGDYNESYNYYTLHEEALQMLTDEKHVPLIITAMKEEREKRGKD